MTDIYNVSVTLVSFTGWSGPHFAQISAENEEIACKRVVTELTGKIVPVILTPDAPPAPLLVAAAIPIACTRVSRVSTATPLDQVNLTSRLKV